MCPIDLCTPKHSYSNTHAPSLPGAARVVRVRSLRNPRGRALVPNLSARARSANSPLSRRSLPSEDAGNCVGRLGVARRERDRGKSRFTAQFPLRHTVRALRDGVFFHRTRANTCLWHPCRLLRTHERWALRAPTLKLESRQDRVREGLVKGARFPNPRYLPSASASCRSPARKCERSHAAFVDRRAFT